MVRTIIFLLLATASRVCAIPFTQSELGWYKTNSGGLVINCAGVVGATNQVLFVTTNTSTAFRFAGFGGTYSILSPFTNGTLTGFNTSSGDATYNQTVAGQTIDHATYKVSFGGCFTSAVVTVNISTNLDGTVGCYPFDGAGQHTIDIIERGLTPGVIACIYYTNEVCQYTNECQTVSASGVVFFRVLESAICPNDCITVSNTACPAPPTCDSSSVLWTNDPCDGVGCSWYLCCPTNELPVSNPAYTGGHTNCYVCCIDCATLADTPTCAYVLDQDSNAFPLDGPRGVCNKLRAMTTGQWIQMSNTCFNDLDVFTVVDALQSCGYCYNVESFAFGSVFRITRIDCP